MSALWESMLQGVDTTYPSQTEDLGAALATALPPDAVLGLRGDLGAGKTTLVRGLARGLGINHPIHSPTFNIYSIYQGDRQLIHCDAYRLTNPAEFDHLLIDEFLQSPWLMAVEWPENIPAPWLEDAWMLHLSIDPTHKTHHLRLSSKGSGQ